MVAPLLLTVILHNPVFNGVRCIESPLTIGNEFPLKPIHKWGNTIIRIDKVMYGGGNVPIGYILYDADGVRAYGAPLGQQSAESVARSERIFILNGHPDTNELRHTIAEGIGPFIYLKHFPGDGYIVKRCVTADLRGH